jgi:hypothetical protein
MRVLLPLALIVATVLGLGSYYETSDDQHLAFLFQGVTATASQGAVPLYFHGLGHALQAAYQAWPAAPWYGLLLAGLLAGATLLMLAVLDQLLRPQLRPGARVTALLLFFLLAGLEHWLWFSHVRVAAMLALSGVLFAAQRPGRVGPLLTGLGALLLAWLLRPSAAGLGVLLALPAAYWLGGGGRRVAPVLGAALGLLLLTQLGLSATGAVPAGYRGLDSELALILDYQLLSPAPRTPADSLCVAAVDAWLLGDEAVVNESALQRAYRFDSAYFLSYVLPAKLGLRLGLLARDYFPLLLLLAITAGLGNRVKWRCRRRFLLAQLGFGLLLLTLAGLLKLPPRLALPLLTAWLLTNLAYLLSGATPRFTAATLSPRQLRLLGGAILISAGLYAAKALHRSRVLGPEQERHEQALAGLRQLSQGHIQVLAGADDLLKSLSPFRTYELGPGPVLTLSGWPAHTPAQAVLRRQLSGSASQAPALRRLASLPAGQVSWIFSAEAAHWLNRRFRGQLAWQSGHALPADSSVRVYTVRVDP